MKEQMPKAMQKDRFSSDERLPNDKTSKANNIVSDFDHIAYRKIRDNIDSFMQRCAKRLDNRSIKLLDIAPQDHAGAKSCFIKSHVQTADISKDSGADYIIDITDNNKDKIPSESFDIIVCTEVLEHTLNPFLAIDEIHRLLKLNGLLLMTTPFNFRIHGPLPDCWRFTEHGIRALLKCYEIIELTALDDEERFLMPLHYTTIAKKIIK